ncbi:ribonuclease P/MRP protein subunit POP5-like [Littorina saxatilis]|uniref:Ribonuclease P/MRP protein subunit POP5 n=1 Tax=Littorina saxatilis TaxID=31220 RepID=A0AAN9AHY1_9CAEN
MVRLKHRYFLAEIIFPDGRRLQRNIKSNDVYFSVREALHAAYGDYGIGVLKSSLMVKYLNKDTHMVIVRAKRDFYRLAQAALTFVKKIGEHDAFLNTLHIGGTIRACQKFLIRHHRQHLPLLYQECDTQEERDNVQLMLLSSCVDMETFSKKTEEKERSLSEIAGESLT